MELVVIFPQKIRITYSPLCLAVDKGVQVRSRKIGKVNEREERKKKGNRRERVEGRESKKVRRPLIFATVFRCRAITVRHGRLNSGSRAL